MKILIISIVLVGLAIAGMAISILLKKGGRFPNTHVEHNEETKKRGLSCAGNENPGCEGVPDKNECESCLLTDNFDKI